MTEFWIASGGMALLVAALLTLAFIRGRATEQDGAADLRVYRDQLREVEKDVVRGVIFEEDAERLRIDISRRILEVDRMRAAGGRTPGEGLSPAPARLTGLALVLATVVGTFALYWEYGAPGYPDMPLMARLEQAAEDRATRRDQPTVEAEVRARAMLNGGPPAPNASPQDLQLVQRLREVLATRPDDVDGHRLLAMAEGRLGNFEAAHELQDRVITLMGDAVTPEDFLIKADFMINAAWGYVSPEAEVALEQVLRRDPTNPMARFFYGMMFAQNDRPDLAFQLWRQVLNQSAPSDPWVLPIRDQIELMAMRAGVEYTLPALDAPRGPSQADIAAAMELDPEDRVAMIEGMVAQLSDRLASEGGTAEDWARLIAAYGVMGSTVDASAIWTEAQVVFANRPDALATVRAAAEGAGVAQ